MIAKLRISVERKYIYPFFKVIDGNNSGAIEYDEWAAYLGGNWRQKNEFLINKW